MIYTEVMEDFYEKYSIDFERWSDCKIKFFL